MNGTSCAEAVTDMAAANNVHAIATCRLTVRLLSCLNALIVPRRRYRDRRTRSRPPTALSRVPVKGGGGVESRGGGAAAGVARSDTREPACDRPVPARHGPARLVNRADRP